ncbi:MAG: tyrosinase family protein [Pseudomonadota bacterium]
MAGPRRDIASLGGTWSDTMLWYARAVGEMRGRPFADRTSWVYLGSLHGVDPQEWINQGLLPDPIPSPPPDPLPDRFQQCQHAGWFFLPWHRGYLFAMEAILADWITAQGGPADWALPYWNYLDDTNPSARDIPQEFLDATLPDGSPNPLSQAPRGPAIALGPQPWIGRDITLASQTTETVYTAIPGTLGYGGPISGYAQFGNSGGANESNPHNLVHVMVGGDSSAAPVGWMFDPNFAALDPIFWVHHCNVDRLWEAWMSDPSHTMELGAAWKNGPFPTQFTMPNTSGALWIFVPEETLPGEALAPSYDNLHTGTGISTTVPAGRGGAIGMAASPTSPAGPPRANLLGASSGALTVTSTQTKTRIQMASAGSAPAVGLAGAAPAGAARFYLNVEGVKGTAPTAVVNVVLTETGADPSASGSEATVSMVLFGLANATEVAGPHGGSGLSATEEITDIVAALQVNSPEEIEAHVTLPETASGLEVTIERISIYERRDG